MSSQTRKWALFAIQSVTVCIALLFAWLLRYEFVLTNAHLLLRAMLLLVFVRWTAMYSHRLTHAYWRYTGVADLKYLARAVVLGTGTFFVVLRFAMGVTAFPLSVYVLEMLLSFSLLALLRVGVRLTLQWRVSRRMGEPRRVLIVGAGAAGTLLLHAMKQTACKPVGFVDDDPAKQRMRVGGVNVLGRTDDLQALVSRHDIAEILIALPSASAMQMMQVSAACRQTGVPFRSVPSLASLAAGRQTIESLQEVKLEDLLGREPVITELDGVNLRFNRRVVMVTGAAGSIGSELCRQLVRCNIRKLICLDQAETPLFHLEQALADSAVETAFVVADITDTADMRYHMRAHGVQVIFHAAAYKHVPLTESNPHEGLKNNVFGLLDLLDVGEVNGCEDFVLISSDKAVHPSSLMGCTKRIGELIVGARLSSRMRCVSVRFGNVLGSHGSVIPIFQEQIRTGRAVTITHPQMTRYFMTIPEASALVLQAFAVGHHAEILVLDMGKPVRILELARTLARVLGKQESSLRVVYTGIRPGEKLHEELFYDTEQITATAHAKVMRAQTPLPSWPELQQAMASLRATYRQQNGDEVRRMLQRIVPEYDWTPRTQTASPAFEEPVQAVGPRLATPSLVQQPAAGRMTVIAGKVPVSTKRPPKSRFA